MMECKLVTHGGTEYLLPALLEWRFCYGLGVPCDSFSITCLWQGGVRAELEECCRFIAQEGNERLFTGVVDEYRWARDETGTRLELEGRGLGALLLDNESEPVQYTVATLGEILRRHVTPYGVAVAGSPRLPAVGNFVAAAGASQWQVLYDFARYHGGVPPRFDRQGRLLLEPLPGGTPKVLDGKTAVAAAEYRERRHGVLSQVVVRDKVRLTTQRVTDPAFQAQGGSCSRVLTMPGASGSAPMRHTGQFQLERSKSQRRRLTVTLPGAFAVTPGDLVAVTRPDWWRDGLWRAAEVTWGGGREGRYTTLSLVSGDAVL